MATKRPNWITPNTPVVVFSVGSAGTRRNTRPSTIGAADDRWFVLTHDDEPAFRVATQESEWKSTGGWKGYQRKVIPADSDVGRRLLIEAGYTPEGAPELSNDWPYAEDGVLRDEFAESLRIPLLNTPYPRWPYITSVVAYADNATRPTNDELRAVEVFHDEYFSFWYTFMARAKMRRLPFDIDSGANGRILIKYRHDGWGYRHASWQEGPLFWPGMSHEPMGLVAVLDAAQSSNAAMWERWKAAHADVIAAVTP